MLNIPDQEFLAYLFDCDGTIADSMPLHHRAWLAAIEPWGGRFPEDLFYAYAGRPTRKIVELLNEAQGLSMPADEVEELKERTYFELMPEVRAVPEVVEHIHAGHGRIPMAVVSGSPRESVIKTLKTLGLLEYFGEIIGAEDYKNGKPSPDAFLLAAKRLFVEPTGCLVFEDADLGVQAAEAAGMKWVKVDPPWKR